MILHPTPDVYLLAGPVQLPNQGWRKLTAEPRQEALQKGLHGVDLNGADRA